MSGDFCANQSADFSTNQNANHSAKMGANLNVAIFGGSFNPPHKGHCAIIKSAIECEFIDFLIILPNFKNPLKTQSVHNNGVFLDGISRINALEAMVQGITKQTKIKIYRKTPTKAQVDSWLDSHESNAFKPKIILLSHYEIMRKKPSFAIHSILHFKELYAPKNLYFIIGADILSELEKWHKIDEIRQNARFIVATRDNIPIPSEFLQFQIDENISSTEIRNATIHSKNGTNLAK